MKTIAKVFVKRFFPRRGAWSHKGEFGRLLVVGGSPRYSGSPALVALAAIRAGADLTLVAAPRRAADIIARFRPDLITEPLGRDCITPADAGHVIRLAGWADSVVIGSGIGRKPSTFNAVRRVVKEISSPCVIDAEAIRAVAGHGGLLKKNFVLTPHADEFYALAGRRPKNDAKNRADLAGRLAKRLNCTIVLKGHVDVISNGRQTALNKTGNPAMTKGGTGDSLAGICGALLARGITPFDAACAAAWLNGAAGDAARRKKGEGFLVSEMIDLIPQVL